MLRISILLGAVLLFVGCSRGPERAPVGGTVLLDDKPLTTGSVLFVPKGGGPSAKGEIQPDGAYQLKTEDGYHGAVLGSYYVAVMAFEEKGRYQPNYDSPDIPRGSAKDSGELVPAHYMDPTTSNITYDVESGNNDFTIRLSSKK